MSKLHLRLQRYKGSGQFGRRPTTPRDGIEPGALFPGEEKELATPAGNCYVRELSYPLNYFHGPGPLSELLTLGGAAWGLPAKDKELQKINPAGSLFVDIETTGLGGGSGIWAFLIGAGWFESSGFKLRQYFLRRLPEEKAMIHHFTQAASPYISLVTFNGKTFDLPIIWNRQVLTGAPSLTEPPFHVDLLHCSRRLYAARLGSCSLKSLEESLLAIHRQGDIPGEEIPAVYFDYLRHGDTTRLKTVFEHNVIDVLSMVALLCHIIKTAEQTQVDHPADYLSLGKLYLGTGQLDMAIECFKNAIAAGGAPAVRGHWQLSLVYKQQQRWEEAVDEWEKIIDRRPNLISPYLELAKFYEHRCRNLPVALDFTKAALVLANRRGYNRITGPQGIPALQHRKQRLLRKLGLSSGESTC